MNAILIVADYEEFKPETYKGCYLFDEGKKLCESYTGNFETDYMEVCLTAQEISLTTGQRVVDSSSIDDWFMDNKA
jgi:hypothetical protein